MKKYISHGVKNFRWDTENLDLAGIYSYLARPKISSLKSKMDANMFILNFCQDELNSIMNLKDCAKLVQKNWESFKKATILNS